MPRKPLKLVMIRRGESKVSNIPSENLITFIRKRALLGTDELSGDGKNWIRVDRHYQLQKYFPIDDEGQGAQVEAGELSPDLKGNLEEVADLLKDING
jgi:hypothetical protein